MTSDYPIYVECCSCGNRWYQDEGEPHRCEVCGRDPYGRYNDTINIDEAWAKFTQKQKELLTEK